MIGASELLALPETYDYFTCSLHASFRNLSVVGNDKYHGSLLTPPDSPFTLGTKPHKS